MRVFVESVLPCQASRAWDEVQKRALLEEVARPLVTLRSVAAEPWPQRWSAQTTVRCRSFLFGLIPLGVRTVYFERIDPVRCEIQSRESDRLVRRWDHLVRIEPLEGTQCRYSDTIEIEAGLLTPLVWLFARVFYRHRQRRWQAVARRLEHSA